MARILRSSLWILGAIQIPIVTGILDFLSCNLDSKTKDSGIHKKFWIPDSKSKNFHDSRIQDKL